MEIIDHGDWVPCDKPENYPVRLPPNIVFARRVSDGKDWYQFAHRELIARDTIKLTAMKSEDGWMVLTTTRDASELFPANLHLFEIRGAPEDHERLRMQRLDFERKQFMPPPPLPPTMLQLVMEELGLDESKFRAKLEAAMKDRRQKWLT